MITENNKQEIKEDELSSKFYYESRFWEKFDLRLINKNFEQFCYKNNIDFNYAKQIGIKKCKKFLKQFIKEDKVGNFSRYSFNMLYRLKKDPWYSKSLDYHRIITSIIGEIKKIRRLKIKKILILGAGVGGEYDSLCTLFPNASFFISDISEIALVNFKLNHNSNVNYIRDILNIFKENSLLNFFVKYGSFDLITAFGVYRFSKNQKALKRSAKYIFKNYLRKKGIFCIADLVNNKNKKEFHVLNRIKPLFNDIITTNTMITPIQLVIYEK